MQEKITIARPYAQAAFEQARDEDKLQQWSALLKRLAGIVSEPVMVRVIKNPKVDETKLVEILCDLCAGELSDTGRNFIALLTRSNRLLVAAEIYTLFEGLRSEAEGVVGVTVISAYEIDDNQQTKIREAMARRLGKDVDITSQIDNSLIGGAVIRAGDSVIDASIRGHLKQLGQIFAE